MQRLLYRRKPINIACFVSPHGYGHAARICAILEELLHRDRNLHFYIYSLVPKWFFADSLPAASFSYQQLLTDVGMVQHSPVKEDVSGTVKALSEFLPFPDELINKQAALLNDQNCRAVLCDISPLGISIATRAGLPSVLIENFTWDWIYENYFAEDNRLQPFAEQLNGIFNEADYHIQARPYCNDICGAEKVNPLGRRPRRHRELTREKLDIPVNAKTVLVSMGGIRTRHHFLDELKKHPNIHFILPHDVPQAARDGNLVILPHHSGLYHPDLVAASDLVVGKVGYSTVAEVYGAGIPMAFITRPAFRESGPLSAFVEQNMAHIEIPGKQFSAGNWVARIEDLVQEKAQPRNETPGAIQAGDFITEQVL